jgi:tetratricopeptide (TPR) repeat protein
VLVALGFVLVVGVAMQLPQQQCLHLMECGDGELCFGSKDAAFSDYRQAALLWPSDARPYQRMGELRMAQGRDAEAIPLYETALRLDPTDMPSLRQASLLYMLQRRFAEARDLLRRAFDEDPNSVEVRELMANLESLQGHPREALGWLRRSLDINPYRAETHRVLARLAANRQDWAESLQEYSHSFGTTWAGDADALDGMAVALTHLGHRPEARSLYQQALSVDINDGAAHLGLALLLADDPKERANAEWHLRAGLGLAPHDPLAAAARALETRWHHP